MVLHRPRAHLVVANARPGAQMVIDRAVRGAVSSGATIDVPIGHHTVEIDTPGFLPFHAEADFAPDQVSTVRIDELRQVHHRNVWIAVSVAGAAVVSGSIFGGLALSRSSEFPDRAAARGATHDNVRTLASGGRRFAVASDISFGVGLTALGAALYLWRSESHAVSSGHIDISASSVSWIQRF
jgi:hypothetical protein